MRTDGADYLGCATGGYKCGHDEGPRSKIGGEPDWVDLETSPDDPLLVCGSCKRMMSLLVQLRADLSPDNSKVRILYVFVCDKASCNGKHGSWKTLRGIYKGRRAGRSRQEGDGEQLFATGTPSLLLEPRMHTETEQDSAGHSYPEQDPISDLEIHMRSAKISPKEKWPITFLSFFRRRAVMDVYQEELELLRKYEARTGEKVGSARKCSGSWSGEGYEKQRLKNYTSHLKKFQKYVTADRPGQCVRYNRGAEPVLFSNLSTSIWHSDRSYNSPQLACSNCGAARIFEFQLMPGLISHLSSKSVPSSKKKGTKLTKQLLEECAKGIGELPALDFGTVLIYTCQRDCTGHSQVSYMTELIAVQIESHI